MCKFGYEKAFYLRLHFCCMNRRWRRLRNGIFRMYSSTISSVISSSVSSVLTVAERAECSDAGIAVRLSLSMSGPLGLKRFGLFVLSVFDGMDAGTGCSGADGSFFLTRHRALAERSMARSISGRSIVNISRISRGNDLAGIMLSEMYFSIADKVADLIASPLVNSPHVSVSRAMI